MFSKGEISEFVCVSKSGFSGRRGLIRWKRLSEVLSSNIFFLNQVCFIKDIINQLARVLCAESKLRDQLLEYLLSIYMYKKTVFLSKQIENEFIFLKADDIRKRNGKIY